ncbi:MAG: metallophosphoesterase [Candidatus Stygibacter frigidus]|nr:metallophosphoesterase [Candidatus Stygibacter frigidus]
MMMKLNKLFITIVLMWAASLLMAVPIYNIQFTEDAGDGTYPSQYENQNVSLSGIVTCNNYNGDKYVLSYPEGGIWNSVLIYNEGNFDLGDEVELNGTVDEYYGYTEIQDAWGVNLLSTGNAVPEPVVITTSMLASGEAYEGVLVRLNNVTVASAPDDYDVYTINDGSGDCNVNVFCLQLDEYGFDLEEGMLFDSITGVVTFSYNEFHILPRMPEDIVLSNDHLAFRIPVINSDTETEIQVLIRLSYTGNDTLISSFEFTVVYDPTILEFQQVETSETLLESSAPEVTYDNDSVTISSTQEMAISSGGVFAYLEFYTLQEGFSPLNFSDFQLNGEAFEGYMNGSVTCQSIPNTIADELTVIQRPILSVPEIVVGGEDFDIICHAPEETQNWQARLNWEDIELELPLTSEIYDTETQMWTLTATTSDADIEIYTTYDLIVSADQMEEDRTVNSVYLIPYYKDDYYFVHITDTHLPGHTFWGNDIGGVDYTEIDDLRLVINTVNIIRPEFVLLTGDVVNEGELEGYNDRYQYSIAKNLITEFDVPVFITSGNHDIGGWNDTLPPDGSSRLNWHRFFGWESLEEPPAGGLYTQNYTFQYDQVLYIGMEAYINYDNYLPSIFGDSSFTGRQMNWLSDQLANTDALSKVMFYHCDFDYEINLSNLGVDMALWGHIHSNEGNINTYPYNLATAAVCDGNSAFRVIQVTDNEVHPQATMYAHDGVEQEFQNPNSGLYAQNQVDVNNPFNFDFNESLVVFKMPHAESYQINTGSIEYIHDTGMYSEVTVRFDLPSLSTQQITMEAVNLHNNADILPARPQMNIYPNPFNPDVHISFELEQESEVVISLYNTRGQKIETLYRAITAAGKHSSSWSDKTGKLSSGIYFISMETPDHTITRKVLMMK